MQAMVVDGARAVGRLLRKKRSVIDKNKKKRGSKKERARYATVSRQFRTPSGQQNRMK